MASVFKPVVTFTRADGTKGRRKAKYYWAKYRDHTGRLVKRPLRLPDGRGITDREVARARLREILLAEQRRAAGLVDRAVENALLSVWVLLGRYARRLRALGRSRVHVRKTLQRVKWICRQADIDRLGALTTDRVARALDVLAGRGRSAKTVNEYRAAMHAFCGWLVREDILDANPVAAVPTRDRVEVRQRRALTPDEAERLLEVAPPDRALFYRVALLTGLRVGELRQLEWRDLELDGPAPSILLRAATTKARRSDELPIPTSLADALCQARPPDAAPTDRVFRAIPKLETFWRDLKRAGIPRTDDRGRSLDRHSLRLSFVTWLAAEAGADPRTAMKLARHTDIRLTTAVYTDPRLLDGRAVVERLPQLDGAPNCKRQRATGTLDPTAGPIGPNVVPVLDFPCPEPAFPDAKAPLDGQAQVAQKTALGHDLRCVAQVPEPGGGGNRTPVP